MYYTKEGLSDRVRELRFLRELLTEREGELIMLINALPEKNGYVVDHRGKVLRIGKHKKETVYKITKEKQETVEKYRKHFALINKLWYNSPK